MLGAASNALVRGCAGDKELDRLWIPAGRVEHRVRMNG